MQSRQNFRSAIVYLALGAVIAALYVILTYVSAALNLAYGPVQFRISEALTVLPALGTAALGHIRYKDLPLLAPLPPVLVNALVVGLELACLSSTGSFAWGNFSLTAFGAGALSVGLGELVVCYALGLPLMIALQRAGLADLLARAGGRESL